MQSCLDVTLRWEEDVVEIRRLQRETALTIGNDDEDDLFVPMPAGTRSHPLLVRDSASALWTLRLAPGMEGRALLDDGAVPLTQLAPALADGSRELVLEAALRLEVDVGSFRLELSPTRAHAPAIVPFELDRPLAHSALPTGTFMTALVAWFLLTPQPLQAAPVFENAQSFTRRLVISSPTPRPTTLNSTATATAKAKRAAPRRGKRAEELPRDGANRGGPAVTLSDFSDLAGLTTSGTGGAGLSSALDGILRASGSATGATGGLRGTPGGGGTGRTTIHIGKIGRRASGHTGDEDGVGSLGGHSEREVRVSVQDGEPTGCNAACAAIIRRVVREKSDSVRHCYERALQRTPGLGGRVVLRWVLQDGRVRGARVAHDEVGGGVGTCIARGMGHWRFPSLAGAIDVTYPWVFRSR